jgi:hypothetical protein
MSGKQTLIGAALIAAVGAVGGVIAWLVRPAKGATPPPGGTGTLVLTVSPASAEVIIGDSNGNLGATAAGTYTNIPVGTYQWAASADGYVSQSGIQTIVADQTANLDIVLDLATTNDTGTLIVTAYPASALVTLNGNGIQPGTYTMTPGTYQWSASAAGYTPRSGTIDVIANQTTRLDVSLVVQLGGLSITTTPPGATVSESTVSLGVTPLNINLAVGSYNLLISLAGYENVSVPVEIVEGQTANINEVLVPTGGGGGPAFNYGTPSAYAYPSWSGSIWGAVHFSVQVTNQASQTVTHTLYLYETDWLGTTGNTRDANGVPMSKVVTLAPAASTTVVFDSGTSSDPLRLGNPQPFWVQDEAGNKSAIVVLQ